MHTYIHIYSVVVCTYISGKELHRQIGIRVVTSEDLGGVMVHTYVGSIAALRAIFPIFITSTYDTFEYFIIAHETERWKGYIT